MGNQDNINAIVASKSPNLPHLRLELFDAKAGRSDMTFEHGHCGGIEIFWLGGSRTVRLISKHCGPVRRRAAVIGQPRSGSPISQCHKRVRVLVDLTPDQLSS